MEAAIRTIVIEDAPVPVIKTSTVNIGIPNAVSMQLTFESVLVNILKNGMQWLTMDIWSIFVIF